MGKATILIVEDDVDIVQMLEFNLQDEGYDTVAALNGEDGVALAVREGPDLIILDIMLPRLDGFEVCRMLKGRGETSGIPIIMLSAKSQETDKVVGLELGADDYVTKPFSPRELIARIRAILRRGRDTEPEVVVRRGQIAIDIAAHKVTIAGEAVSLTLTEFRLLELLARRPGRVLSRDRILDAVVGDDAIVSDRTVDAHIKSLRRKMGEARHHIETIRGAGYRFREELS